MRLDEHGYTPAVFQKIVEAGARLHSFLDAAFALQLAGVSISPRHIQNLIREIGAELAQQRDAAAARRRRRTLPPQVAQTPDVVAVEVDGGHLRTRLPGQHGVHAPKNKENKIACLITLQSVVTAHDPQPEPPPSFLRRVRRLVQQMAGRSSDTPHDQEEPAEAVDPEEPVAAGEVTAERWAPRRLVRTCVASMVNSRKFGPLVAAAAQARDFYRAARRAFVADGQAYNWTIHKGYFPDFEAIADLLHVLCYLYVAAWAVAEEEATRWAQYVAWLRACWQGRVAEVIAELRRWQERLGEAPAGAELAADDPRQVVRQTLVYLENNQTRMDYPRYRRAGLPITSSLAESLVGEINTRVKGRQKFWDRPEGAEAILQVRAALLSHNGELTRYFAQRPGCPFRRRPTS